MSVVLVEFHTNFAMLQENRPAEPRMQSVEAQTTTYAGRMFQLRHFPSCNDKELFESLVAHVVRSQSLMIVVELSARGLRGQHSDCLIVNATGSG